MILALAYHDIVYKPAKTDNELQSAMLAGSRLQSIGADETVRLYVHEMIVATQGHTLSLQPDINLFTDADLSVLGSDPEIYRAYAIGIRKEYSIYPDLLYNPGRRKVLKHFLDMDRIFKTGFFHERYETQARINLGEELNSL